MRLGIYSFYDAEGMADPGDLQYLEAVRDELDELIVLVNGKLSGSSRKAFAKYTDTIIQRENHGFDGGAFRDVLLQHLSRADVERYDEIVLFNNTVFGPAYPLRPIFEKFPATAIDFWGMTFDYGDGRLCGHIQSYFWVFRKSVLQSDAFWKFWQELRMDFTDVDYLIASYEVRMTEYLQGCGFRSAFLSDEMVYRRPWQALLAGVPVLKKKNFRSHIYRIPPQEYQEIFAWLAEHRPELLETIQAYMERFHFDWRKEPEPLDFSDRLLWTNKEIFEAVRPYQRIYFYGVMLWTYYLMKQFPEKDCCLVESDAYHHGPAQGGLPILRLSDLCKEPADCRDAVALIFLRKRNADPLRGKLEGMFQKVFYLCDVPEAGSS